MTPQSEAAREASIRLNLLGGFDLMVDGEPVELTHSGQRLIGCLALRPRGDRRLALAGTLWPDKTDARASANLRSILWRLPEPVRTEVHGSATRVRLSPLWRVDVAVVEALAVSARDHHPLPDSAVDVLRGELLPDWDEPWLVVERERLRQARLHVLETLARQRLSDGDAPAAAIASLAATQIEPLRESSQRLLIEADLALGNRVSAIARFRSYSNLLRTEIGVEPSRQLAELVAAS